MRMNMSEICRRLRLPYSGHDTEIDTLLTDSRSLSKPESTLFFAISTPGGNDGHRYIGALYEQGVRNFVVSHIPSDVADKTDATFIVSPDTVETLQRIASWHPGFHGRIMAITGSRGKTTLKEWLFQLLEPLEEVTRSPRSYNSQTGVPLSMWTIKPSTSMAIIEAGISRMGEMEALRKCIKPDTVIFTNIRDDHSEGFSSMEEKAREKASLAMGEETTDIIIPLDDRMIRDAVARYADRKNITTWSVLTPGADLFITRPARYGEGIQRVAYTWHGMPYELEAELESDTDLSNLAPALCLMHLQGYDAATIAARFRCLHKIDTRLNVVDGVNGCSIIYDSYTSDFSSLAPALDFMRRRAMPGQTPTLVLSDLKHETQGNDDVYREIADLVRRAGIVRFIGVGPKLKIASRMFGCGSLFFDTTEEMLATLRPADFSGEIILLKGAPEYCFGRIFEMLEARKHETVLEVNLDSIVKNFNYFRRQVPLSTGIVAMVKASAYGAGSVEIAKTMQDAGAAYLAVAVLDEGIELRRNGIHIPIMVMNPKAMNYKSMFANRLEPEIFSMEMLEEVIAEAVAGGITDYPVHIKLDTGMHRTGFVWEELPALMDMLESHREVKIRSAFTHLATADCPDMNDYTELQLQRFARYTEYMLGRSREPFLRHILNSAGILRYPSHHYDMVRLGIGLYGVNTLPASMEEPLAVVSTLRTTIIAIRDYMPGETIGYGRHGRIERPSRIATIPIGYADGMNRHFGRGAIKVVVNGQEAPTIGNICMDACMIDVTGIDCKVGDSVEIFGDNAPIYRLAEVLDTIPYEVLTSISPRVKRVYYRE